MWSILVVIPWAGAFHRNVTEDSVDDCGDIGFSKWGVISFFRIAFAIRVMIRINCTMTLCKGWIGTSTFLLCGSPGGRGHLFSGTAHGSSFYTARRLLAAALGCSFYTAHQLGGNWCHRVNAHVVLFGLLLHLWHSSRLLPNSKNNSLLFLLAEFTSPIPNWKHTISTVHVWTFVDAR